MASGARLVGRFEVERVSAKTGEVEIEAVKGEKESPDRRLEVLFSTNCTHVVAGSYPGQQTIRETQTVNSYSDVARFVCSM